MTEKNSKNVLAFGSGAENVSFPQDLYNPEAGLKLEPIRDFRARVTLRGVTIASLYLYTKGDAAGTCDVTFPMVKTNRVNIPAKTFEEALPQLEPYLRPLFDTLALLSKAYREELSRL